MENSHAKMSNMWKILGSVICYMTSHPLNINVWGEMVKKLKRQNLLYEQQVRHDLTTLFCLSFTCLGAFFPLHWTNNIVHSWQAEFQNVTDSVSRFGRPSCLSASIAWNPQRGENQQASFVLGFNSDLPQFNSPKVCRNTGNLEFTSNSLLL